MGMKIILCGDVHNSFRALDKALTNEEPFDFFLSVGDVCSLKKTTREDLVIIDKWKSRGFAIAGNHDTNIEPFPRLDIIQNISGLKVAGLSGMYNSKFLLEEDIKYWNMRELLFLSHQRDIDIFVSHVPFYGLDDQGNKALTEVINYSAPNLFCSGHLHSYKFKFYNNTVCISLPLINKGYAVAYFEGKRLTNIEVILREKERRLEYEFIKYNP